MLILTISDFQNNLALLRPAFQSSTLLDSYSFSAENAVDGAADVNFRGGYCSRTNDPAGSPSWLVVDLQDLFNVDHVTLFSPNDEVSSKGNCFKS